MRNKFIYLFIGIVCSLAFTSCNNDDNGFEPSVENVEVQDFMWKAMNLWYFWQEEVPDLADDRFTTNQEYTEFLQATPNPEDFIESLRFSDDRFTFYDDDYVDLLNRLSGVTKSNGLQFFLINLTADDTDNLFGFIRNVVPGSTAAEAGLQRGDIFYGVNGQNLTQENYIQLLFDDSDSYTLNMGEADLANRLVNPTEEEITLIKVENFQEDPIRLATTLDVNGQKIGYLMYRQFNRNFNEELNNVFGQFVADGVTDLVLDMRYNGGGSVNTSRLLASMIYGTNTNDLYIKQRWNSKIQPRFSNAQLEDYFANQVSAGVPINTLNLNRVFVLGTTRTASASELVMNGLDPYIEVIHIGTTTRGKNEFSISLVDNPENNYIYSSSTESNINPNNRWIVQPLVGRNENSVGFFDYTAGFTPDILFQEDVFNLGTFGDLNEPMLARAIQRIIGNTSKQVKTFSRYNEPGNADFNEIETPQQNLMILDKSLTFK